MKISLLFEMTVPRSIFLVALSVQWNWPSIIDIAPSMLGIAARQQHREMQSLIGLPTIVERICAVERRWNVCDILERPQTIVQVLKQCDSDAYPNLSVLLKVVGTVAVTSCECERSGSVLKCLRRWIPNPGVPCSKPLGGSKVDSALHPSKVDKMSTRNF